MIASGKTLDLFASVPEVAQLPLEGAKLKRAEGVAAKARPHLEIAKPLEPQLLIDAHPRELWLAITLPQLPLEALLRQTSKPVELSSSASSDIAFPNLTREVQGGSRGSHREQKNRPSQLQTAMARSSVEPPLPLPPREPPTVIVDLSHNQQRVIACNAAAANAGVAPGIGLNAAYALASGLQVCERDLAAEQRMLEALAQWAGCFTSKVALEAPDALLLEIKGSLKLFGGLDTLRTLIANGLQAKDVQAALSVAPTPLAALAFSRTGQPFTCLHRSQLPAALAAVSIHALRWPEDTLNTLQSMGVQKIGDCLRLPREGFARRFGPQLLLQLDQLLGRAVQPQRTFIARERFTLKREFDFELEDRTALLLHVQPLFQALEAFLRPRQCGVQSLELQLRHRDQASTRVVLRFLRPMADATHAHSLLTERLEQIELPAPVLAARVRSGPLWPLEMETLSHGLLNDPQQGAPQALTRLIERLRTRLGHESVQSLQCIAEHRPELASRTSEPVVHAKRRKRLVRRATGYGLQATARTEGASHLSGSCAYDGRLASKPADQRASLPLLPRPFWLLPQPQPLKTQQSWPEFEGRLALLQGPERIESGWWDGHDICRDYYMAATVRGLRVWIYRERKTKQWYLHGIYG
jgi:protein ImuB